MSKNKQTQQSKGTASKLTSKEKEILALYDKLEAMRAEEKAAKAAIDEITSILATLIPENQTFANISHKSWTTKSISYAKAYDRALEVLPPKVRGELSLIREEFTTERVSHRFSRERS